MGRNPLRPARLWPALILTAALALGGCGAKTPPPPPPELPAPTPASGPALSGASYVVGGQRYHLLAGAEGYEAEGLGSWNGGRFHGRQTASGEIFDQRALTAAHKTLPFGSLVEVVNQANGQAVVVRINDRGPFHDDYVIDLSRGAAEKIGLLSSGPVTVRAVSLQK